MTHQLAPWHFPRLPPVPWPAERGREVIERRFVQARAVVVGPLFLGEVGVYPLTNATVSEGWTPPCVGPPRRVAIPDAYGDFQPSFKHVTPRLGSGMHKFWMP